MLVIREGRTKAKTQYEGMKLSRQKIANMTGCTQISIHRCETGNSTPGVDTLLRYSNHFDVSMDYIFGRSDNPHGKL